jgi:6-phosphogluconolactonase/glucosamine-6-phosphate isomerase/deaminase
MHSNINQFETAPEAAAAAGERLNALLLENQDRPILLLLSGGSALEMLEYISASAFGEHLTISMLDERFSQEKAANNFASFQSLESYNLALEKNTNFIGTLPRPGELPEDLRARWEISLKTWRTNYPDGKIFATFGIGSDGHTAGIFPMPEDSENFERLFENNHWVTAYQASGSVKYPHRVTTTFSLFKLIDEALVYTCGSSKTLALKRFLEGTEQPHQLPALGIYQTKHFELYTDQTLYTKVKKNGNTYTT